MRGRRDKDLCSACNRKVDLHTWYLPPRYMPLAVFSNLIGDESKKVTATTMLKYPKTDFRIGKPELQKHMKTALCRDSSIISWLLFDQPLIGIEPTFSRIELSRMLERRFFFSTNQPDCFRISYK